MIRTGNSGQSGVDPKTAETDRHNRGDTSEGRGVVRARKRREEINYQGREPYPCVGLTTMTGDDQQENGPAPPRSIHSSQGATGAHRGGQVDTPSGRSTGWLTVNDAMDYLDAVKLEFRDQPETYDEFLAIMGRFKSKQMLPPDVIVEVARLFRGRNSLVLRFNRFLPEGYKIGISDIERLEDEYQATERAARSDHGGGAALGHAGDGDRSVMSVQSGDESDLEDRTVEFDHAINYVTTIKRRFSEEIGTYKAFLEILHTYQREQQDTQSGINHVLEQITDLFADEPDLLREFTYFLPDTVQAQAKERLDRAAVEAEARLGRAQNGQRLQRLPVHKPQSGPQRGQARGKPANSSRDQSHGNRMQQRAGPRESSSSYRNDNDMDQDWREQRTYGRSTAHRGYQGNYGSRSNGGTGIDPDRYTSKTQYTSQSLTLNQRRRLGKGRQMWSRAEDYELGPDGVFKGPTKRAREPDDAGAAAQGRGWPPTDSQGATIKTSPANQLFDHARDVLSSSGDDNDWTEFLKCLDLFSNEILGRDELLELVHDLFEAHDGFELMDEFKDLVYRRGKLEPPPRDAMPTLGLSEINFQSAKMCTPSYRELPKDYQGTACSGRNAVEDAVLNDTWASVPVGSEDSNNFKHMRRNPNEEQLFKMEDERFELDMLIDCVAAAIARLEPVEEEIEALRATTGSALGQTLAASAETSGEGASTTAWSENGDVSLPRFQFRLDKRTLGPLHLSTVSRLYGDHGPEVVDLLRKNPAVAVPVVLKRLRQKEEEWCAAREEATSGWKELAQKHFHKSLDHRTHHFRREDKRQTSNRALLQEIKDRKVEEDPQRAAVVKAAREMVHSNSQKYVLLLGRASPTSTAADADSVSGQGSAGEVDTAALDGSGAGAADIADALPVKNDPISTASRPQSKEGIRALRQQAEQNPPWYMFAHLTLPYPTEGSTAVHKDIMELLTHTLARRPPSEDDVRQASTVVADLLPAFFALATSKQAANEEEGKAPDGNGGIAKVVMSLPVLSSDDDSDHESSRSSGDERKGDRQASSPIVTDEAVVIPVSQGGTRAKDAGSASEEDAQGRPSSPPLPQGQKLLFTTTDFYLVLRMHHLLAERLAEAKKLCREAGLSRQTVVATPQEVLRASAGIGSTDVSSVVGDKEEIGYRTLLGHLYDLLEEKITTERYEEGVRQLVGNQGYVLCNLDKLVVGLLQNLYRASADKVFNKLTQLYYYEQATQSQGISPVIYRNHAQELLCHSEKEVVRVQYHPGVPKAAGWLVKPELKMEFIGRMGTEAKQEGALDTDSTNDGIAQNDAAMAGDDQ